MTNVSFGTRRENARQRLLIRDAQIVQHFGFGQTLNTLANAYKLTPYAVFTILTARGVVCQPPRTARPPGRRPKKPPVLRAPPDPNLPPKLPSLPADAVIAYYGAGATMVQVAAFFETTHHRVRDLLRRAKAPRRKPGRQPSAQPKPLTERQQAMVEMYQAGFTLEQTGEEFGLTRERIRQILVLAGVKSRPAGPPPHKKP